MKVQIKYRNYIPLYPHYFSFDYSPIPGIEVYYEAPRPHLRKLYSIYSKLRENFLIQKILPIAQKILFNNDSDSSIDLELYVGMLPKANPKKPFLLDVEHVNALYNFTSPDSDNKKHIIALLNHQLCKGILPWSHAAMDTIQKSFGSSFHDISHKVQIVYPALNSFFNNQKRFYSKNNPLKLLFIGKEGLRKGLSELLQAYETLHKQIHVELTIVSNTPSALIKKFRSNPGVRFYKPNFSLPELHDKFYSTHDVFIMPTLADSFGLVLLEAMSAGLAVITTNQFATPEIINNGITGILLEHDPLPWSQDSLSLLSSEQWSPTNKIKEQITLSIVSQIIRLYNDPALIRDMGTKAKSLFHDGEKFSFQKRNEVLSNIFYK